MEKTNYGFFTIELVFYLFLSVLLIQYLLQWLVIILINVRRISIQANIILGLMFAHLQFLQTINKAPCQDSLWLSRDSSRCLWKNSQETVCFYYKNGFLIQKTRITENGITNRLVLLNNLSDGNFHYILKNNSIEKVIFSCRFDQEEKEFFLIAKTQCEVV
jgi:hypothetical protein